ncbi:hypothetical protein DV735_g3227, partial [Chaetothyriales sp. CBS 134920]
MSIKGVGQAPTLDGSNLRVAIVHARWNTQIIDPLVAGAKKTLAAAGVKPENIALETVPGSYELPLAVQRIYSASQIQSAGAHAAGAVGHLTSGIGDLLGGGSSSTDLTAKTTGESPKDTNLKHAFDAIIAIGVLIKGETMHFEYISEAVSHGLMRVQLDAGVPVIFGLLTVLTEDQGLARAGVAVKDKAAKVHNHGEDWGNAAVELGLKRRGWLQGKIGGP